MLLINPFDFNLFIDRKRITKSLIEIRILSRITKNVYEILHDRINLFSNVILNFDIYSAKNVYSNGLKFVRRIVEISEIRKFEYRLAVEFVLTISGF